MALLSTVFTTSAQMERKVGTKALENWGDYSGDYVQDTDVINDAINQATEEITLLAGQRYSTSDLANSELIKRWATALACYFLAQTRANPVPEVLEVEFERIMKHLYDLSTGVLTLPGVNTFRDLRPTMSNMSIDRRYRRNRKRKSRRSSTSANTTLKEDRTTDYPID